MNSDVTTLIMVDILNYFGFQLHSDDDHYIIKYIQMWTLIITTTEKTRSISWGSTRISRNREVDIPTVKLPLLHRSTPWSRNNILTKILILLLLQFEVERGGFFTPLFGWWFGWELGKTVGLDYSAWEWKGRQAAFGDVTLRVVVSTPRNFRPFFSSNGKATSMASNRGLWKKEGEVALVYTSSMNT